MATVIWSPFPKSRVGALMGPLAGHGACPPWSFLSEVVVPLYVRVIRQWPTVWASAR